MPDSDRHIPKLERRFLQPEGWQWVAFERGVRHIRYGYVMPKGEAKGVIVVLPGLSEFCEKYFETSRWALENNYGFFVLDWYGQGKSGRYLDNPHKRHSSGFEDDVADLRFWIEHHIKPVTGELPLAMLAMSMGANIGLHYLAMEPKTFDCAYFLAPMFGIKTMMRIPFSKAISKLADRFASNAYVPGGGNWKEIMHPPTNISFLTRDKKRNPLHNKWLLADSGLQVGGVTFGWVYQAHLSCLAIDELDLENLDIPVKITAVQHEILVDNQRARVVCKRLKNAKLGMIKDSYHEPLFEREEIRAPLLENFGRFLDRFLSKT